MTKHRTPPQGYKSQEDRDLAELARRRAAEQAKIQEESEGPVPQEFVNEELTKPTEIIERGTIFSDPEKRDLHAAQLRYEQDGAFRALWNMTRRQRRESANSLTKVGNAALEAQNGDVTELSDRLGEVEHKLTRIDTLMNISKFVVGGLIMLVLGGVMGLGYKIYGAGYTEGTLELRVQQLEKVLDRMIDQRHSQVQVQPQLFKEAAK